MFKRLTTFLFLVASLLCMQSSVLANYTRTFELKTAYSGHFCKATVYDNGQVKRIYDGKNADTQYDYDSQSRPTRMTTWRANNAVTTDYVYNQNTGLLEQKKLFGLATPVASYIYRDNGQPSSVTDGEGVRTDYAYNNAGDRIASTTSDGTTTINRTFDRMGMLAGETKSNGVSLGYAYALDGNLLTNTVSGNGIVSNALLTCNYGADNFEITNFNWTIYGVCTGKLTIAYDAAMRVSAITNGPFSAIYSYPADAFAATGLIIKCGTTNILTKAMTWDFKNMRITNMLYKAGTSNAASYAFTYGTNDLILKTKMLDSSYVTNTYDGKQQLTKSILCDSANKPIFGRRFGYSYDENDNIIAAGPLGENGNPVNRFDVNALNFQTTRYWTNYVEVTGYARTNATVTINDQRTVRQGMRFYGKAVVNNSLSAVQAVISNRACYSTATNAYTMLKTGTVYVAKAVEIVSNNVTRGFAVQDSRFAYEFNRFDKSTAITSINANPNFRVENDYYPQGLRVTKKYYESGNLKRSHQFYYDGRKMIAEVITVGSTNIIRQYLWGLDIYDLRTGKLNGEAWNIGGLLLITEKINGVTKTYATIVNNIGTVMGLVDVQTRAVVAVYDYDAYGLVIRETGIAKDSCPFRFQSRYWDRETETYDFIGRTYAPKYCRFLSRDLDERYPNRYRAFSGNPIQNVDFDGNTSQPGDFGWDNYYIELPKPEIPTVISAPNPVVKKVKAYEPPQWAKDRKDYLLGYNAWCQGQNYLSIGRLGAGTELIFLGVTMEGIDLWLSIGAPGLKAGTAAAGKTVGNVLEKAIVSGAEKEGRGILGFLGLNFDKAIALKSSSEIKELYLKEVQSAGFIKRLERYNAYAQQHNLTVVNREELIKALKSETAFRDVGGRFMHQGAWQRSGLGYKYRVQGSQLPFLQKSSAWHEMTHVGQYIGGAPENLAHELAVAYIMTPELYGTITTVSGGMIIYAGGKYIELW